MNPEERRLLERSLKLAEENNEILKKMRAQARRQTIYGFIRLVIILLPFVLGYFLLEPYFDQARENYNGVRNLFNSLPR
ncbi:MAG: hypothetical protein A2758_01735 [Candidatus Zambryskibacteria bacterium RIFCSPHIGHO2_01_FULL_49_18]|uniref:Uncharacterized protein n=2 Tax=Candidatus Zambryskiibacteriota TaxID=1817925 RepID=A0A1G2T2E6_9BACT|nr:MAG: hypothetical protein A2758_01735 [Candidatus Zambryskibacteria bacterium RIFCSPHIGHO2_01_FULL_49_18]OHB05215.1 MAG: hypothetical protein A3A26_02870 [Candidatus Zambryskibacteria bacterium RIFCSPLOWO2_01_FULL_47_14]